MPRDHQRSLLQKLCITAAGVAVAFGLYAWIVGVPGLHSGRTSLATPARPGDDLPEEQQKQVITQSWAELPMTAVASTTAVGPGATSTTGGEPPNSTLDRLIREAAGLAPQMRDKLRARARDEMAARAGGVEDYERYADSDRSARWLRPSDPAWQVLDEWWKFSFETSPPTDRPTASLFKSYMEKMGPHGPRIAKWSDTAEGVRLLSFTVRTPGELSVRAEAELEKLGKGEKFRWLRSSSGAPIPFRAPVRDLSSILADTGLARVVVLMTIVETESGVRFNWCRTLVWDPKNSEWMTESESRRGWKAVPFWY